MPPSKGGFRTELESLVKVYAANEREFKDNREYNEFSLRREFLDSFFDALGWDMRNKDRRAPHEREVRFERQNDRRKRPDYTFLIERRARFIVEAKAPSESLDNPATINQAKSYAWNSSEASIAILTNFDEFKVYDGSLKPDRAHPERGLLKTIRFREYVESVDYFWNFSRDAVSSGSLEDLLPKRTRDRQYRVPVDEAFLSDISEWREKLAKDLYKRSPEIGTELLNEVVQRTLDRLVFIRMAEDRGIIPDTSLWDILQTWKQQNPNRPIQGLVNELYHRIHDDLDGEIFEPHACEDPDFWFTPAVFADLVEDLYFPKSPYLFGVIGVELLGSIYERYLGKTLRLTEKRVHLEEKPEVRKAGGVFYTPRPVVEYIVETAVGDRILGQSPQQMSSFKVLDPACGSGSFLVSAFSRLEEEHVRYYEKHPGSAGRGTLFPDLIVEGDSNRLSIEKKSEILKNSIFGVDIDPQAVEITMMSLYLKALEGEQALPSNKALLPRLKQNIRCGNSLVSRAGSMQLTLDGSATRERLNPFDWDDKEDGFGKVLSQGKFGAVIGNPPYIRIQQLKEWSPAEAEYVQKRYSTAQEGNVDIYIPFIEKGLELLRPDGLLGFIVSHKFIQAKYGARLRRVISQGKLLGALVSFGYQQIFDGCTTYTCMVFLSPDAHDSFRYAEFSALSDLGAQLHALKAGGEKGDGWSAAALPSLPPSDLPWSGSLHPASGALEGRLLSLWPRLNKVARVFRGGQTSADNVFLLELAEPIPSSLLSKPTVKVRIEGTGGTFAIETEFLKPLVKSGEIHRYHLDKPKRVLIFPYRIVGEKAELVDITEIEKHASRTASYLQSRRKELQGRKGAKKWWAYGYPKNLTEFEAPKLITRDLAPHAWFCFDQSGGAYFPGGAAGGYGIRPQEGLDPRYLLGLLNSRLLDSILHARTTVMRNGWYSYEYRFIKDLPIRTIEPGDSAAESLRDEIVARVDRLLVLWPRFGLLPESAERERIGREVRALEAEINDRVERLYGLSEAEAAALKFQEQVPT